MINHGKEHRHLVTLQTEVCLLPSIQYPLAEEANFWYDNLLNGQAPCEIASLIFNLAWRKNKTVMDSIMDGKWMRGLERINCQQQLDQFIVLWEKIQAIELIDVGENCCPRTFLADDVHGYPNLKSPQTPTSIFTSKCNTNNISEGVNIITYTIW